MKRVALLAGGLALMGAIQVMAVTPGIKLTVTTSNPPTTAENDGRYVMAMWIQNSAGAFVNTFGKWARARTQYLYTWNTVNGGDTTGGDPTVDGVTSATRNGYGVMTASWDLKNNSGVRVPNGQYWVCAEFTELHAQGPMVKMRFDINGIARTVNNITPDSTKASGATYISAISVEYTENGTAVEPATMRAGSISRRAAISHDMPMFDIAGKSIASVKHTPGIRLQRNTGGVIRAVSTGKPVR